MTGLSDAEGDGQPAVQSSAHFSEQHDVVTPVMTPPGSVSPTLGTPLHSLSDEQPAVQAIPVSLPSVAVTQLPAGREQATRMVDAVTECAL